MAPLIAFAAEVKQGVGLSSLTTFAFGALPLFIFLASFLNRKAFWKITSFDLICGGLSVAGLLLWAITQAGNWAILFAIKSWDFAHYAFPVYIFFIGFLLVLLIKFKLGKKIQ